VFARLLVVLIIICVGVVVVIAGEGTIANAVNSTALPGISTAPLKWVLPGSLLFVFLVFLTKVLALKES